MDNCKVAFLLAILVSAGSCQQKKQNMSDDFYIKSKKGDLSRIPLRKPVELISADEGFTWFIKPLYGEIDPQNLEIGNIDKIGMSDSVIVAYARRIYFNSGMTQMWIIINLKERHEKAITEEAQYADYLRKNNLNSIELLNVNEVFKLFDRKKELPFILTNDQ